MLLALVVLLEVVEVVEVVWQPRSVKYEVSHSNSCLFPRRKMMSTVEQDTMVLTHVLTDTGGVVTVEEVIDVVKQAWSVT